eukprot:2703179-Pleurochrysis_carterae.AAC.1
MPCDAHSAATAYGRRKCAPRSSAVWVPLESWPTRGPQVEREMAEAWFVACVRVGMRSTTARKGGKPTKKGQRARARSSTLDRHSAVLGATRREEDCS